MASLLLDRRFAPLFCCQFLAAFGDNALKSALVFVIVWGREGGGALVALAGAVFIAPFFLLSGLGGELADRYDKALVARRVKRLELLPAALAAWGVASGSVPVLFAALACFGVASALFGPVKYGMLPDQLPPDRLPAANALIETATFAAILAGTVAGGAATAMPRTLAGLIACGSILAWITARLIPPTGRSEPGLLVRANVVASAVELTRGLRAAPGVWRAALINAWFWLVGSVALALLPPLVRGVLGGDEAAATLALCVFAVGVAAGAALAARLARRGKLLAPCPAGALLVGVALIDLWWTARAATPSAVMPLAAFLASPGRVHALGDLAAMAVAGSLIAVPSFTAIQAWSPPDRRARSVAGANIVAAGAMVAAALTVAGLQGVRVATPTLLGGLGTLSMLVAAAMAFWLTATNESAEERLSEAPLSRPMRRASSR